MDDCNRLVGAVIKQFGAPDILFNNAGHSIRRSISRSYDRFHDIERTMQLNYFGGAKLILGFLPAMVNNGGGQIIHSSTMGTMAPTPRFGAYLASKAAMDAFLDALVAEFADRNISTTAIKFPLVKTPMIAPTKAYADAPAASPESAARMFVRAVRVRPRRVVTDLGKAMGFLTLFAPEVMTQLYNYGYRLWPDGEQDYPEMNLGRRLVSKVIKQSPL
jgi:NAD(P)-dependent dehydrogenase (short-subunit alcohol dehydrogenase family)